ncbi:MAG: DNA polymerase III subunit gamma/tau [Prevotellaceae bacterium]|jgi:DNA polymerase-3 subunit gamma/tau|nr:DNA polymerase III subunit gamma/tau [Prevotellaceae bacterium]
MEQFVVSAIKYRPLSFSTVVGQSNIGVTLRNAIQRGHLSHAYLFCGPRGVGKTTCARIFAKTINCTNPNSDMEACGQCESCRSFAEGRSYNIHELDAASNNSVDDIRILIDKVRIPPQVGKYGVYIIDEVHMLSSQAFNAFLKTLEEPPAYAVFIMATTEKHKVIPTILSRCQIYDFSRITIEDAVRHLKYIAEKEGVTCDDDALNIIARKADGAMRDALSIFDRVVSFCGNNITYAAIIDDLNILDYDYYFKLTAAILKHDWRECYMIFDEILKKGFDPQYFVSGLSAHFRDILVCKDVQTISLLEVGQGIAERYKQQAAECPAAFLYEALNIVNRCETAYKSSWNPRWLVELTLLNLSYIGVEKKNESPEELADQKQEAKTAVTQASTKQENSIPQAPKGISLKSMLSTKPAEPPEEKPAIQDILKTEERNFSAEELVKEWKTYAESVKDKMPRLSSRLLEYTPEITENNTIIYPIISEQHREGMEKFSGDLIQYLRQNLSPSITVEWVVKEYVPDNNGEKTRLYTQKDKIEYVVAKNSVIGDLIKDLDLDYR